MLAVLERNLFESVKVPKFWMTKQCIKAHLSATRALRSCLGFDLVNPDHVQKHQVHIPLD